MEVECRVRWGNRDVKARIAEIAVSDKLFETNFDCDIVREYEKMGLQYQATLQRQKNRINYVERFGFRMLDEEVLYEITRYYIGMWLNPIDRFRCNWDGDIFQSTWSAEGGDLLFHKGDGNYPAWMRYKLSSPWCLPIHAKEQIPMIIAKSLYDRQSLFDMILISSTAHITAIERQVLYRSPVAIGKIGINSYLLAYWGDYPKFLEYPDFKYPKNNIQSDELVSTERKKRRSFVDLIFMNREDD